MEHRLFIATLISTGIVIFGINHVSAQLTPSEETTYFDDFSSYTPGSPPSGWILRGADQVIPTVKDVGGTGPSHRLVDFPEVPWQYWGRTLLKDGLIPRAPYTVMVKLNFQHKVADRAGLTIAWNDNSNYVEIQPNIYGNDIEFRPEYNGPIHSNLKVNSIGHIPISPFTNYWLRVEVKDDRPGQGQLSVLWSTDGTNFIQVMSATGLQNLRGLVGVSTAGPHLPHVYFDDFSVSAPTEEGVRLSKKPEGKAPPSALLPPVSQDDIDRAWKCGLSAGLRRLKTFGPEGEDLYKAIKATLIGRNLAENRDNLKKAAVKFGIDIAPYGACFEPIFFPPAAGGGARPVAPTNLTVSPDPTDGTVIRLTWQDNSHDVWSFEISNGNESRSAPAGTVEYAWTGLKPGSWNCFRVRADNGDTFSDWAPNTSPKCAYSSR